jgi:hypothetical protein
VAAARECSAQRKASRPARAVLRSLESFAASPNQGYDEQNQENDEANFGDRRSRSSNDAEAEDAGDKSNDQKYNSVA